ncbi:ALP1-like protein [Tanacetum coccineum]
MASPRGYGSCFNIVAAGSRFHSSHSLFLDVALAAAHIHSPVSILKLTSEDLSRNLKYVVPTGRVKVPAGRYVVPTGKDNVIVSTGRTKVIPAGCDNTCLSLKRSLRYYLVDGIYPELAPLVKTILEPADDDHKRILYKQKQESARKDMERAFVVLTKKWAILVNPTRALRKDMIVNMMYTCIILHSMIRKYKKVAISPRWFSEEAHQPEDMLRNEEQVQQVMRWIR